jgi:hypothetical protein
MLWVILIIVAIVFIVLFLNSKTSVMFTISNNQHDMIPNLLDLVEEKGSIVVDSYTDSQYSKNKIGWYLNSYKFVKEYNQSDKYIAEVDFFDNDKRIGDIKRIVLRLNPNPQPIEFKDEPHVYKSSRIKLLFINGLEYRELTDKDLGKFYGYVKTEPNNEFDKYAVAIFNDKDKHIGYVPRGDEYLFNTLELIDGRQQAWGYIYKELHIYSGKERLQGRIYIPIKCSKAKIEKAISEFQSKKPRKIVEI